MSKQSYPSDKQDQYMIRFPDGMRDRLKEEAAKNNRSLNAEIVARLEHSMDSRRAYEPDKTLGERLALVDELTDMARGLLLQEVEIAKSQGREVDLEAAKKLSDHVVKQANRIRDE